MNAADRRKALKAVGEALRKNRSTSIDELKEENDRLRKENKRQAEIIRELNIKIDQLEGRV